MRVCFRKINSIIFVFGIMHFQQLLLDFTQYTVLDVVS